MWGISPTGDATMPSQQLSWNLVVALCDAGIERQLRPESAVIVKNFKTGIFQPAEEITLIVFRYCVL